MRCGWSAASCRCSGRFSPRRRHALHEAVLDEILEERVASSRGRQVPRGVKRKMSGLAAQREILILRGHEDGVFSAGFSPDGTRIVTGSWDKTARVWMADGSGQPVVLRGHEDGVLSAGFSPDGARVVTGSWDRTARVWMADGSGEPLVLRHEGRVTSAGF